MEDFPARLHDEAEACIEVLVARNRRGQLVKAPKLVQLTFELVLQLASLENLALQISQTLFQLFVGYSFSHGKPWTQEVFGARGNAQQNADHPSERWNPP